ncbi:DNA-directed RNA polymerase II subunit 2 [Camellia lanceoleosa]|nr:DNA-directed RNA polymerase II subunit 2 [Camellia lanceoleosa]
MKTKMRSLKKTLGACRCLLQEKGAVHQQLDSFDEFIQNTMQEIVDESADIEIRPDSQHNPGHQADLVEVLLLNP